MPRKGIVRGTALAPGVSRNKRLYTTENIANAYERLKARLADPSGSPVVMRTHHLAGDDSTHIVGQITEVNLTPDGRLTYVGKLNNTTHADTIAELATPKPGEKPTLAHVSVFGRWLKEPVKKTLDDGTVVETDDDLEIDKIDFTATPGVAAASATVETGLPAFAIHESFEAEVTVTETGTVELAEADKEPYGNVTYADPGYQTDGKKRYPIDTADHVRAAWSYINQTKNEKGYTAAQVKRIKTRIRTAAKKVGVTISDSWLYSGHQVTETDGLGEHYGYADAAPDGSFCFRATNGPICVEISSYCIDPADLEVITAAACKAISDVLCSLDPDMDGDIDLPGAPSEDTDGDDQMETAQTPAAATAVTENEATAETVAETHEEGDMADEATATTEGAATEAAAQTTETAKVEIDYKALAEAFLEVQKAQAAETQTAAETAPADGAAQETAETAPEKGEIREALKDVVRELLTESGTQVGRKGYAAVETADGPSAEELWDKRGEVFVAFARENRA